MRILPLLLAVATVFVMLTTLSPADIESFRYRATSPRSAIVKDRPMVPCATSLDECPDEGCTSNPDRPIDHLLNQAKNRTDVPAASGVKSMTLAYIKDLQEYEEWPNEGDRSDLADEGEGMPVRIKGYLLKVKKEGAESCNCELTGQANTDLHLVIVSHKTGTYSKEASSITAEITPRVRQQLHPNWTYNTISSYDLKHQAKMLRITGWLMYDTKHLTNSSAGKITRATSWEVHPIMKIEVRQGTKWIPLD